MIRLVVSTRLRRRPRPPPHDGRLRDRLRDSARPPAAGVGGAIATPASRLDRRLAISVSPHRFWMSRVSRISSGSFTARLANSYVRSRRSFFWKRRRISRRGAPFCRPMSSCAPSATNSCLMVASPNLQFKAARMVEKASARMRVRTTVDLRMGTTMTLRNGPRASEGERLQSLVPLKRMDCWISTTSQTGSCRSWCIPPQRTRGRSRTHTSCSRPWSSGSSSTTRSLSS